MGCKFFLPPPFSFFLFPPPETVQRRESFCGVADGRALPGRRTPPCFPPFPFLFSLGRGNWRTTPLSFLLLTGPRQRFVDPLLTVAKGLVPFFFSPFFPLLYEEGGWPSRLFPDSDVGPSVELPCAGEMCVSLPFSRQGTKPLFPVS